MLQRILILFFFSLSLMSCHVLNTKLEIKAAPQINLDPSNQPLAVSMRAYLLADATTFMSANFAQLWHSDQRLLGKDLIMRTEWIQQPSLTQQISFKPHQRARYIAIIALFRNPKLGTWRLIKSIDQINMSALFPAVVRINRNTLSWGKHGS